MTDSMTKNKKDQRAVLYYVSGQSNEAFKLRRDATIFGREKGDIILSDTEVSSTHCQIQNISGSYFLFDMNSTNGTFHNKTRIVKVKLQDGDTFTVGKTTFRFALEEDAKVRHISTIFKSAAIPPNLQKTSLVDTLIEGEIKQKIGYSLILKVKYADGKTEEVQIPQRLIYLGRATTFGQFEQDPEISRKHLLIKLNDHGEIFVEDQGSTNGSYLNSNKIAGMIQVQPTDVVKIGGIEIRISVKSS